VPDAQARAAGVQLVEAHYVSGANPLTVGQPTVISATYRVQNPLNVPLSYRGTVEFEGGPENTFTAATTTAGTAAVTPNRVTWDGFGLAPGESATITLSMTVTPANASAGRPVTLISSTLTTARTPNGALVEVRGGALTSDAVAGLDGGGLVVVRGVPGGVQPGVSASLNTAPGAAGAASVAQVPRTGTGMVVDRGPEAALPALLVLAVLSLIGGAALRLRRR
jgi:hypothetical protein